MRKPRVHAGAPAPIGSLVEIPAAEAHHLARVLRRGPGDPVTILLPGGGSCEGAIRSVEEGEAGGGPPRVIVEVLLAPAGEGSAPILPFTLGVAIVKGESFDLAIRMAAELGIEAVAPLWTARTIVRPGRGASEGTSRAERWERIAREAAKQCGRAVPLRVEPPRRLEEFLRSPAAAPAGGTRWIALPGAPFRPFRLLDDAGSLLPALFLVGPEGGFTPEEEAAARDAGYEAMGLPAPVLRTPTAVALIAAVGMVVGEGGAAVRPASPKEPSSPTA